MESEEKGGHVLPRSASSLFDQHVPTMLALLGASRMRTKDVLHIRVAGEQGGEWTVDASRERATCVRGLHGEPTRRITIAAKDLMRMLEAKSKFRTVFDGIDVSVFFDDTPQVELSASEVSESLMKALDGTFIKVDHKQNQPTLGMGEYSFIQFGPLLSLFGLADRALDVPVSEHGTGDFAQWATLLSGGWYTIDRVRFLVNNLHARLGADTTTVALEPGAIRLDIAFASNNPTLEGQANAYLVWLFGIPVGWVDAAFPDIHIPDFVISLRLAPEVTKEGAIALSAVAVEFRGTLQTNAIGDGAADGVRSGIRDAFAGALDTKEFRDAFANAISTLLGQKHSPPITKWVEVTIDESGIFARGTP